MRLLIAILTTALTAVAAHAGPRSITFDELPDPAAQIFEDPFREMGVETLRALATVARLEARLATDDLPAEDRLRLEARLVATRDDLTSSGCCRSAGSSRRSAVSRRSRPTQVSRARS